MTQEEPFGTDRGFGHLTARIDFVSSRAFSWQKNPWFVSNGGTALDSNAYPTGARESFGAKQIRPTASSKLAAPRMMSISSRR